MKISVISSDALPSHPPGGYAGLEVITFTLAQGLAALGHAVTLFALSGSDKPNGCELIEFDSIVDLGKYKELFAEQDCLTDHSWQKAIWSLRAENPQIKGIATHHAQHISYSPPPLKRPNLVGLTHFHAGMLQGMVGVPVRHVYNGIALDYYPLSRKRRSNRLLYLNRLHPEKGAHFHIALARLVGLPLDLIGTESYRFCPPEYIELILRRCDGKKYKLWGDPGQDIKVELLQKAKCLLWITPDFNEPFGMGLIESMACGTPVIALNRGSTMELIREGGVVINHWVEFRDALKKIEEITPEMCRANAEQFSVENMCQGYLRLLEEVADGGGW